jgi:hypothetical protein
MGFGRRRIDRTRAAFLSDEFSALLIGFIDPPEESVAHSAVLAGIRPGRAIFSYQSATLIDFVVARRNR